MNARIAVFALAAFAAPALAQSAPTIANAWMRPAAAGAQADAYADIRTAAPTTLAGVRSASAGRVEIVLMDPPGSGELKVVSSLALPAGVTRFALKGSVLRLVDVRVPLANGDPVTLSFVFRDATGATTTVDAPVTVRGFMAAPPPPPMAN